MSNECCYQLIYENGEPVDTGDGIPCFPTLERATEDAPRFTVDPLGTPKPKQLAVLCVVISCSECDYILDEDDALYHFLPDEVDAALRDWEWKVAGDKRLCPECAGGGAS